MSQAPLQSSGRQRRYFCVKTVLEPASPHKDTQTLIDSVEMASSDRVELLTGTVQQMELKLAHLRKLLTSLRQEIPVETKFYNFSSAFTPSPDDIEDYGEEGALN